MTARTDLVEIICDGPSEGGGCPDDAARATYGTALGVRQDLREDGWATALAGGIDRCTKCRKRAVGVTAPYPPEVR